MATKKRREERFLTEFKPAYDALMKFYPFTLEDLDGEIWRDIDDYEGDYQISNFARAKTLKFGKVKILRPTLTKYGYLQFGLRKPGRKDKKFKAHQLVGKAFIPNPENKPQVNHIDTHRLNNHVSNLEWTTNDENQEHAKANGLHKSGEDSHNAQLSNELAEWCREVYIPYDPEFGAAALARKLGVSREIIRNIVNGKTYKNAGGGKKSNGDDDNNEIS